MATLVMLKGPNPGHRLDLVRDKVVIGRNPDCDVVVTGGAVSREHTQVFRQNNQFFVKDLRSRNKTYVNNEEIKPDIPVRLRHNDRIRICDFLFAFYDGAPPEDLGPDTGGAKEDEVIPTVMSTVQPGASSQLVLEAQPAEKLKMLLDITNKLTRTLELDSLLPQILDSLLTVYKQADRGFIVVRDEGGHLIPKVVKARRQKDEEQARFARSIIHNCIDTGQSILLEDAQSGKNMKVTDSISEFRIRSVMCAPLRGAEGTVFGVIQLDTQDRVKKFTREDLELLVAVSNQAAVAMDNARLHEEKMELERRNRDIKYAIQVQQSFLPSVLPAVAGYEFFAHYKPARDVGGDLYSFVPLAEQRLAVSIGDVSGKGVPAALLMARVIADIRYCVTSQSDPAVAVGTLNKLLQEAGINEKFVTFELAVLDCRNNELTVVNAGHIPLLVRRAATGTIEEVGGGDVSGLPLGVLDDFSYSSCRLQLEAGDVALLITDGIMEAMNVREEQFGLERINDVLHTAPPSVKETCLQLLEAVEQHAAGFYQSDDITLVGIGRFP